MSAPPPDALGFPASPYSPHAAYERASASPHSGASGSATPAYGAYPDLALDAGFGAGLGAHGLQAPRAASAGYAFQRDYYGGAHALAGLSALSLGPASPAGAGMPGMPGMPSMPGALGGLGVPAAHGAAPSVFPPLAYAATPLAGALSGLGVASGWYPPVGVGALGYPAAAGYQLDPVGALAGLPTPTSPMMYQSDGTAAMQPTPMLPPKNPFREGVMTGSYGPAAAAAAAASAWNVTGRTVYVGGIPANATADELLNLVKFGPIENVKSLAGRNCVFISFLDGATAAAFYADARVKKLTIRGSDLKIGWGRASEVAPVVAHEVAASAATRCVFLGDLTEDDDQETIAEDMGRIGMIDQVKIVLQPNRIAFVHFLSISDAIKAVRELRASPEYQGRRVGYGKDRCAYVPRAQQDHVAKIQRDAYIKELANWAREHGSPALAADPALAAALATPVTPWGFDGPAFGAGAAAGRTPRHVSSPAFFGGADGDGAKGRNVYIGNLHPETTVEDLCNNIRGGLLENVRIVRDKNCAFVAFVDPDAAARFIEHARASALTVRSRRLRIGWGRPAPPLKPELARAVEAGLTRNVYVGGIDDTDAFSAARLRADFEEYGEVEQINFLRTGEHKAASGAATPLPNGTASPVDAAAATLAPATNGAANGNGTANGNGAAAAPSPSPAPAPAPASAPAEPKWAAFINFTSLDAARAALEGIKADPAYARLRVAHGKDRCANAPRAAPPPPPAPSVPSALPALPAPPASAGATGATGASAADAAAALADSAAPPARTRQSTASAESDIVGQAISAALGVGGEGAGAGEGAGEGAAEGDAGAEGVAGDEAAGLATAAGNAAAHE